MPIRYTSPNCPECGEQARGTLEKMEGCAELSFNADGTCEHNGYTEVFYDSMQTQTEDGLDMLVCRCGHAWRSTKQELPDSAAPAPEGDSARKHRG